MRGVNLSTKFIQIRTLRLGQLLNLLCAIARSVLPRIWTSFRVKLDNAFFEFLSTYDASVRTSKFVRTESTITMGNMRNPGISTCLCSSIHTYRASTSSTTAQKIRPGRIWFLMKLLNDFSTSSMRWYKEIIFPIWLMFALARIFLRKNCKLKDTNTLLGIVYTNFSIWLMYPNKQAIPPNRTYSIPNPQVYMVSYPNQVSTKWTTIRTGTFGQAQLSLTSWKFLHIGNIDRTNGAVHGTKVKRRSCKMANPMIDTSARQIKYFIILTPIQDSRVGKSADKAHSIA